jgi:UDP-N-acetylglucosamine 4,6-dehydratase
MMTGGELYVPRIPSMKIVDLANAVAPGVQLQEIGMRPGEKLHEEMISADDSRRTIILENRFVVTPVVSEWGYQPPKGSRMPEGMAYRSDTNELWISESEIKNFIKNL